MTKGLCSILKAHLYGAGISHSLGCHFSHFMFTSSLLALQQRMFVVVRDRCSISTKINVAPGSTEHLFPDIRLHYPEAVPMWQLIRLPVCLSDSSLYLVFLNKNVYLKDIPVQ